MNHSPADSSVEVFVDECHDVFIVTDTPTSLTKEQSNARKHWQESKFSMEMTLSKQEQEFLALTSKRKTLPSRDKTPLQLRPEEERKNEESDAIDEFLNSNPNSRRSYTSLVRKRLRDSVTSMSSVSTNRELEFLSILVDELDNTDGRLEICSKVLMSDPLFDHCTEEEKEDDDNNDKVMKGKWGDGKDNGTKQHQPKHLSCFSRESLWKHCMVSSQIDKKVIKYETNLSLLSACEVKNHQDGVQEEENSHDNSPGDSLSSLFSNFCHGEELNILQEEDQQDEQGFSHHSFAVLGTLGAFDKNCQPHVLSPFIMDALRPHMPHSNQEDNYWLKYSMVRDGAHVRSLLANVRNSARAILAIETTDGDVFGSFTSSPWRPLGRTFYGSCEAFVWRLKQSPYTCECNTVEEQARLESDVEVFPWSKKNRNIQSVVNHNSNLVLGGGGLDDDLFSPMGDDIGSALIIDANLERGTSQKCLTFDSPCLITSTTFTDEAAISTKMRKKSGIFEIANVEVWTMTPVEDTEQAERLEYRRNFVFENSNFVDK